MTNTNIPTSISDRDFALLVDISAVQTAHTAFDVETVAKTAMDEGFIAVHALPNFTKMLATIIPPSSGVIVGGPIGFPSGGATTATKLSEAIGLVEDGARELDLMMNIARLKSGDLDYVREELNRVIAAVSPIPVKVIIEVSLLSKSEVKSAAQIVSQTDAAFVKTGTGWTGKPTTIEHIKLIREAVLRDIGIKASGGIRDLTTVAQMIALGVTRFGVNAEVARKLQAEIRNLTGGRLIIPPASGLN